MTTEHNPLDGLSAWLRCAAGGAFIGDPNHATLLQWASEADALRANTATVAGGEPWLPSFREHEANPIPYQDGYSWGWNDCLRRIKEQWARVAASNPVTTYAAPSSVVGVDAVGVQNLPKAARRMRHPIDSDKIVDYFTKEQVLELLATKPPQPVSAGADSERLDWMAYHSASLRNDEQMQSGGWFVITPAGKKDMLVRRKTAREAIDAAIKASTQGAA